jgi:tetratricopeptide (TPR) repeat protein
MRRGRIRQIAAVAAFLAAAGSAYAQAGRASGLVKDEQGAAIKGATVTATADNPDATPNSLTSTTDDKGRFGMIGMQSGLWNFIARAPGYSAQVGTIMIRQGSNPQPLTFALKKVLAPPSALGSTAAKDLQTQLGAADDLYNGQKWDEAIAAYRAILASTPALNVINLQIAAAYRNKHEYAGALAAYNDLLKIDPNNDKARVGIAMTNLEKGDLAAAAQTLEAAAQTPGATREVFYNLGELRMTQSKADEAVKAYEQATRVDPSWGKPYYALGRVAMSGGDTESAAKQFQKVIDVDPSSPEAAQARAALAQIKK